jgi:hypothetical protein
MFPISAHPTAIGGTIIPVDPRGTRSIDAMHLSSTSVSALRRHDRTDKS